jgi:hypothetical protein
LNRGLLPIDYYALPEQITEEFGRDALTLSTTHPASIVGAPSGDIALAVAPPKVDLRMRSEARQYAAKAKAVAVRRVSNHRIIAMIEIVSPGNKNSRTGLDAFVRKALALGVHLLVIDLFPPTPRDPQGMHRAIWGDDCGEDFVLPSDRPLTCVAYLAGVGAEAFVQFASVGTMLPKMPLFLTPEVYVEVPLQPTYDAAFDSMPEFWRRALT